jgi:hypothetical protein
MYSLKRDDRVNLELTYTTPRIAANASRKGKLVLFPTIIAKDWYAFSWRPEFAFGLDDFAVATQLYGRLFMVLWEGKEFSLSIELWCGLTRPMIAYSTSKVICTNLIEQREDKVSQEGRLYLEPGLCSQTGSCLVVTFTHARRFLSSFCCCPFCSSQIPFVVPISRAINSATTPFRDMVWEEGL